MDPSILFVIFIRALHSRFFLFFRFELFEINLFSLLCFLIPSKKEDLYIIYCSARVPFSASSLFQQSSALCIHPSSARVPFSALLLQPGLCLLLHSSQDSTSSVPTPVQPAIISATTSLPAFTPLFLSRRSVLFHHGSIALHTVSSSVLW